MDSTGTNTSDAQNTERTSLAATLRAKFDEAKDARSLYEQEWLKDLRQYLGVYDPGVERKLDKNRSHAFIRLTRTKVKAMDARLKDMMFPAGGDKNWSISPTPVSTEVEQMVTAVSSKVLDSVVAAQQQQEAAAAASQAPAGQQGDQPGAQAQAPDAQTQPGGTAQPPQKPTLFQRFLDKIMGKNQANEIEDKLTEAAMEDARSRCRRMEKTIDDQLTESRYAKLAAKVMHSGNLYGTGILKGPLVEVRKRGSWQVDKDGMWTYADADEARPYFEFCSIWDMFPDLKATNKDGCEFIFQRHVMLRSDLRKLAKRKDFDGKKINQFVRDNPEGDTVPLAYETELLQINQKTEDTNRKRRFEVLEYWGYVDGMDLKNNGLAIPDDKLDLEFEANVWLLGNQIIKAVFNPFDASFRPYHFHYFDEDETGVFGVGIPRIMRDTQTVFNALIRAAIDNSAISAGPMFEVIKELLAEGEDSETIAPFRVWLRKVGNANGAVAQAIRAIQIPNNAPALMNLASLFKQLGDEATAIPAYTHGEQDRGVARTVGGLSMLMGAANITMKDTVRNYDTGITIPAINAVYHWNMQFNPDDSIKGDYNVEARGTSSLVAKEIRAQQLENMAAGTANQLDAPYVKRGELVKERYRALDLDADQFVYTEDEVAANQKNQPPPPEMLKYQVDMARLQMQDDIAKHTAALKEAELALKQHQEAFREREAAMIMQQENIAKLVEQLQVRV